MDNQEVMIVSTYGKIKEGKKVIDYDIKIYNTEVRFSGKGNVHNLHYSDISKLKISKRYETRKRFMGTTKILIARIEGEESRLPDIIMKEHFYNTLLKKVDDAKKTLAHTEAILQNSVEDERIKRENIMRAKEEHRLTQENIMLKKVDDAKKTLAHTEAILQNSVEDERIKRENIMRAKEEHRLTQENNVYVMINSLDMQLSKTSFKDELINNYRFLSPFYTLVLWNMHLIQRKHMDSKHIPNIYLHIAKSIYEITINSSSASEVDEVLRSGKYYKELCNNLVSNSLQINGLPEYIAEHDFNKLIERNMSEEYLYETITRNKGKISYYIEMIQEEDTYDFRDVFMYTFMAAMALNRLLLLARNKDKFINNEELFKIYLNLSKVGDVGVEYIVNKLYPIYKEFYSETFNELLSEKEFCAFIHCLKSEESNDAFIAFPTILETGKKIAKDIVEDIGESEDAFINNYKNHILGIDMYPLVKDYADMADREGITYVTMYIYNNIVWNICRQLPYSFFNRIIDKDYWDIIDLLVDNSIRVSLNEEKERLLNGDMSKEIMHIEDAYSFENILSGYDFEDYLNTLFAQLGYTVTTTKKSSDQGGDLVLVKDGVTTVMQAKYYSSPVGNKAIQEVVASIPFYGADKGIVVTNNRFTDAAMELAKANNIELIDGEKLSEIRNTLIENIPINVYFR